jgi:type VI secretion system protein ImpK
MMPSTSFVTLLPLAIRDTALTVASLHAGDFPKNKFDEFRTKCKEQVDRLEEELSEAGHAKDVIDDALYAQCALLDETVLRCLKNEDRDAWEHEPLQVTQFNSHDAGEELIKRMETRLHAPQPNVMLLLIFHTVLLLGFQGRFAVQGETERYKLLNDLSERLEHGDPKTTSDDRSTVIVTAGPSRRCWPTLSPLAWVMLTAVLAALLYGGLQHWLSTSIAALTQR